MGNVLEVIGFNVTMAASAALKAVSANTGDSLTVRSFPSTSPAYLLNLWGQQATAGYTQVRSPRLHDNVRGIRTRILATTPQAELAERGMQMLYTQDDLTVENIGGNSEVDAGALLVWYGDVPGLSANLAMWDQVKPRIVHVLTSECLMTAPATAGEWGAGVSLDDSSTGDLLKANTDYAVLGYLTDTVCASVGIKGADTGNVRVGGPGTTDAHQTRGWFVNLSQSLGLPTIPIINSANKGNTNVAQANNAASGTPYIDLILAELRPGS